MVLTGMEKPDHSTICQIKQARGFRQLLHRGLRKVATDWSLLCSTHNLLKLLAVRGAMPAKV